MTDRPILFSGPMVRAILDGHKTQTRRVLKLPTKGIYEHPKMGGWADGRRAHSAERAAISIRP